MINYDTLYITLSVILLLIISIIIYLLIRIKIVRNLIVEKIYRSSYNKTKKDNLITTRKYAHPLDNNRFTHFIVHKIDYDINFKTNMYNHLNFTIFINKGLKYEDY
jgi:hypothetical protein